MNRQIAITNGMIIDGTGNEPIENGVIRVENGMIQEVGHSPEVTVEDDAQLIDAGRMTVMPGMIEGHAHVPGNWRGQQILRLSLQRGITTIASVSAGPEGAGLRDAIEQGQVRGCSRLLAGCIVCCTNGHVKGRRADGPWEVRKAVREMVKAGADFIKTCASGGFWAEDERCSMRNYTRQELAALADEAHAWDVPVVVHAHTQPGINNAVAAGIDQIHHGAFMDNEGLQGILENDLYFVPTLRVTCEKNIQAWPDRPWMIEEMRQAQPIHRDAVSTATEMGIKLAEGTDYPGSEHTWRIGDSTPWEWQELVKAGLSPMETLVAGTRNTADAYRVLDELGTLEPDKKADLLIIDGNPLENIACMYDQENIALVMRDGRVESVRDDYAQYYSIRQPLQAPNHEYTVHEAGADEQ